MTTHPTRTLTGNIFVAPAAPILSDDLAPGRHDIMVPTINSYILSQHIPNAELILYPDSGHGSLFQYPHLFVSHVARFLDADVAFS